jgi:hypothetical protein
MSSYSFDCKNGGTCEKINDDEKWVDSREMAMITDDDEDEWIMI